MNCCVDKHFGGVESLARFLSLVLISRWAYELQTPVYFEISLFGCYKVQFEGSRLIGAELVQIRGGCFRIGTSPGIGLVSLLIVSLWTRSNFRLSFDWQPEDIGKI